MIVEPIELERIRSKGRVGTLASLEVGQSIYVSDAKEAESIRVSSYYFLKTRGLPWKFVSRKMDRGWRIIRVR
jgi:hypothetical protein